MKYIDIDRVLAEIESRMGDCKLPNGNFPTPTSVVRYEELSCLRNFFAPLKQGQSPLPHNVDEAAKEHTRYYIPFDQCDSRDIRNAFKAGAEWMARQGGLTISDIEKLHTFLYAVKNNKQGAFTFTRLSNEQYEEVLHRFNNAKKEKAK